MCFLSFNSYYHAYLFKELSFSWLLELSLVIMLILLRELASVALVDMSMIKCYVHNDA